MPELEKIPELNIDTLSYSLTPKGNPKDTITVEIGDSKDAAQFQPQVKIMRWDNEANSSIRLQLPGNDDEVITQADETVTLEKGIYTVNLYDKPDASDDGGFEFEIVLKEKPPTNKFNFTVNTKELDWFYQPEIILSKYEIYRQDIVSHVTQKTPKSLVDLGGGTGELAKVFDGMCVDISNEAYELRVTDNFLQEDITKGLSIDNKQFDLATGIGFLKYIPEKQVETTIKEIARISNRGFFTLGLGNRTFTDTPPIVNDCDVSWWLAKFNEYVPDYEVEVVDIYEGIERPDNVIGSYAVYHKTKGGMNDALGMDYKCGKAFHVYRPEAIDNKGDKIWGLLHLDEQAGILTISIDQTWLDNAIYPVIIDPTFGYTTSGGSTINGQGICQNFYGTTGRVSGSIGTASEAFTPTKISLYIKDMNSQTSVDAKCGLYSISGTTGTLINDTVSSTVAITSVGGPKDFTITGATEKSAADYGIMVVGDPNDVASYAYGPELACDTATNTDKSRSGLSEASFTLSSSITYDQDDVIASIYVTYTAGGGATGPANLKTYNTNAKANIKTINTNPIANVKTLNTNA